MGIVPKAETQRNNELIADYLSVNPDGSYTYTISQLGVRYARIDENGNLFPLTATRIHQILKKNNIDKNRVVKKKTDN